MSDETEEIKKLQADNAKLIMELVSCQMRNKVLQDIIDNLKARSEDED